MCPPPCASPWHRAVSVVTATPRVTLVVQGRRKGRRHQEGTESPENAASLPLQNRGPSLGTPAGGRASKPLAVWPGAQQGGQGAWGRHHRAEGAGLRAAPGARSRTCPAPHGGGAAGGSTGSGDAPIPTDIPSDIPITIPTDNPTSLSASLLASPLTSPSPSPATPLYPCQQPHIPHWPPRRRQATPEGPRQSHIY